MEMAYGGGGCAHLPPTPTPILTGADQDHSFSSCSGLIAFMWISVDGWPRWGASTQAVDSHASLATQNAN